MRTREEIEENMENNRNTLDGYISNLILEVLLDIREIAEFDSTRQVARHAEILRKLSNLTELLEEKMFREVE